MHLLVVLIFGMAIWRPREGPLPVVLSGSAATLACVLVQPLVWWLLARGLAVRALRRLRGDGRGVDAAQLTYHRASIGLRFMVFAGFASAFYLTRWPELVTSIAWLPKWSGLAQLVAIAPFFISILAVWHGLYPADRALRAFVVRTRRWEHVPQERVWSMGEYLVFHARHQLLTVAVPMTVILVAWSICTQFRRPIIEALRFWWAPDALLALVAAGVFVFSPVLLKSIWSTAPLGDGPLRGRLEQACRRAGLRCRDILVWRSHGMMINAAVMGLLPQVRYVLLSDALLDGLDDDGIEAVFGHEAGHIRHHHIPYFLLFALVSVLAVSAVMEVLLRLSVGADAPLELSDLAIQGIGLVVVALLWGTGFGWISRRFERQADLFGAQVASPPAENCREACGVHALSFVDASALPALSPPSQRDGAPRGDPHHSPLTTHHSPLAPLVCATGAKVFVSALDRVAVLNGIPHEEPSWRHSSIGSRMRFLTALAGDPALGAQFQRRITAIKRSLWGLALGGLAIGAGYTWWQPDYRELIYYDTLAPLVNSEFKIQNSKKSAPTARQSDANRVQRQ